MTDINFDPTLTALNIAGKLATKVTNVINDTLGIDSNVVTKGNQLKIDLGLELFKNVYIQKIIGISVNVYVITFDSRYPDRWIPRSKFNNFITTNFLKLKSIANKEYKFNQLKLTPPFNIEDIKININSNSVIVLRDIAGEYFNAKDIIQNFKECKIIDYNAIE